MKHISDWHQCDVTDEGTYPKVSARVQVKFEDGRMEEGDSSAFFPRVGHLPASAIVGWRYIARLEIK
jgi:hypothetical protein